MEEYISGEDPRAQRVTKRHTKHIDDYWKWIAVAAVVLLVGVSVVAIRLYHTPRSNTPTSSQGTNNMPMGSGGGPSQGVNNVGGPPPSDCSASNGCSSNSQSGGGQNYQGN